MRREWLLLNLIILEYVTVPKHIQEVQNVNQFFVTEWLDSKLFDYNDLIGRGLAEELPTP